VSSAPRRPAARPRRAVARRRPPSSRPRRLADRRRRVKRERRRVRRRRVRRRRSDADRRRDPGNRRRTAGGGGSCPTKVTIEGQGDQADLDSGWNGHRAEHEGHQQGRLTVALDCHGNNTGSCGSCDVSGPIASTTVVNNHRCAGNTSMTCSADGDCASSGPCQLHLRRTAAALVGGVPVCVTNRVSAPITGTANPDTGSGASTVALISAVFTGLTVDQPARAAAAPDSTKPEPAAGGARDGMSCTVHGTSAQSATPASIVRRTRAPTSATLNIALNPTTGTSQLAANHTCTTLPFNGKAWLLARASNRRTPAPTGICTDPNGTGGTCEGGRSISSARFKTFRGCFADSDCPTGAGQLPGSTGGTPVPPDRRTRASHHERHDAHRNTRIRTLRRSHRRSASRRRRPRRSTRPVACLVRAASPSRARPATRIPAASSRLHVRIQRKGPAGASRLRAPFFISPRSRVGYGPRLCNFAIRQATVDVDSVQRAVTMPEQSHDRGPGRPSRPRQRLDRQSRRTKPSSTGLSHRALDCHGNTKGSCDACAVTSIVVGRGDLSPPAAC